MHNWTPLRGIANLFGLSYQRLRNLAGTSGEMAWPVTTKVHKMQHVPELANIINPVHLQCYADESLMGTSQKVWKKLLVATKTRCKTR